MHIPKSSMGAIDYVPTLNRVVLLALAALLTPASWAQTVNGVDYSDRAGVYDTFDMSGDVVFGKRFPSEHLLLKDEATGVEITVLTTSRDVSSKMYQTHPQWTSDGRYVVFRSNRADTWLYYAVSMDDHEIVQVTTSRDVRDLHLGWKDNLAYYFKGRQLIEFDLGALLDASKRGGVEGTPDDYERVLATLPEGLRPTGGVGLDADQDRLFFASRLENGHSGIFSIDFASGAVEKLIEVPFRANHLQANPWVSGEVMYCWETGGDAPQRIWYLTVGADGTVENRPLFEEDPNAWVTHEVFMGPDHILFNVMGHLQRLQERPTGVFSLNIRTNEAKRHQQVGGGGFWHSAGTKDLKWGVADTFDGSLYRIDLETGKTTLLTTGHRPNSKGPFTDEAHSHHSISPDGTWVLFNSSMLTASDLMMVPLHPEGR